MKIDFEGRLWEFSQEDITIKQGMAIYLAYGLTIRGLLEGIQNLDVRAIQCDYWLMLQQNGVEKPIKDCDFDPLAFMAAMGEARDREAAEEAAEEKRKAAEAAEAAPAFPTSPPPGAPASSAPAYPTATTPQPAVPMTQPGTGGTAY